MSKPSISLLAAAIMAVGSTSALAQQGSAGPLPGAGDPAKISDANRSNNSDYNHLIGSGNAKPNPDSGERRKTKHAASPATVADVKPGSLLRDSNGVQLGSIDSVDAEGAVVNTGQTKIRVPVSAFGKDDQGLLLGITAAKFNELVAQAHKSN